MIEIPQLVPQEKYIFLNNIPQLRQVKLRRKYIKSVSSQHHSIPSQTSNTLCKDFFVSSFEPIERFNSHMSIFNTS